MKWFLKSFFFYPCCSGNDEVTVLEVSWPDGTSLTRALQPGEMNSVVEVAYPKEGEAMVLANDTQVRRVDPRHELWTPVIFLSVSDNEIISSRTAYSQRSVFIKSQLLHNKCLFFQCGKGFTVKNGRCAGKHCFQLVFKCCFKKKSHFVFLQYFFFPQVYKENHMKYKLLRKRQRCYETDFKTLIFFVIGCFHFLSSMRNSNFFVFLIFLLIFHNLLFTT